MRRVGGLLFPLSLGWFGVDFPTSPAPNDSALINLLHSRHGTPGLVRLQDGQVLEVFDIAWGYDPGEDSALITTNCGPPRPGRPIDTMRSSGHRMARSEGR